MQNKKKSLKKPVKSKKKQDSKFKKGQSGNPNGRPKGSKSYKTLAIEEMLEDLGCNPIEGMVALADDENTDISIRAKLYSELASYIFPKRKAVEHISSIDNSRFMEMNDDELDEEIASIERAMRPITQREIKERSQGEGE